MDSKLASIVMPVNEPMSIPVGLRWELLERIGGAVSARLRKKGVSERQILRDFKAWRKERRAGRRRH